MAYRIRIFHPRRAEHCGIAHAYTYVEALEHGRGPWIEGDLYSGGHQFRTLNNALSALSGSGMFRLTSEERAEIINEEGEVVWPINVLAKLAEVAE